MFIIVDLLKMAKGLFITLEGSEGAGKSTQIEVICSYLKNKGRKVICVREPGGTPIAEDIRALLKTPRNDDSMCDTTELLLMYAARAQLVNCFIKPKLSEGVDIICDRHDLSTIAYQGGGRGMNMDHINAVRNIVLGDFRPDLTFLLDIDPEEGMKRARRRGDLDRFEQSKMDFFIRVRNTYIRCAQEDPEHIVLIDGAQPLDVVSANVISCLDKFNV